MNKEQFEGRTYAMGGKVKALAGKLVGDKELEVKGSAQQSTGRAQEKLGDIKQGALDSSEAIE